MFNGQGRQMCVGSQIARGTRRDKQACQHGAVTFSRVEDAGPGLGNPCPDNIQRLLWRQWRRENSCSSRETNESQLRNPGEPHTFVGCKSLLQPRPGLFVILARPVDGVDQDIQIGELQFLRRFGLVRATASLSSS